MFKPSCNLTELFAFNCELSNPSNFHLTEHRLRPILIGIAGFSHRQG